MARGTPRASIQAQIAAWKIDYKNRIVSSFNPDLGISIDRNVGKVNSYGFDASIAVRPVRPLMLLALASYIHAELKQNVEFGSITFPTVLPPARSDPVRYGADRIGPGRGDLRSDQGQNGRRDAQVAVRRTRPI